MIEQESIALHPDNYIQILKDLISIPSFSKEEHNRADYLCQYFEGKNIPFERVGNNIIVKNLYFDAQKPTILLNSHIDTVKPNASYTKDPFEPIIEGDKLYGLGSNDAGGCLVSLLYAFEKFYSRPISTHNIVFITSAEEEISGVNGISLLLSILKKDYNIAFGIIGEPTLLQPAIAEKGLMVLDVTIHGVAGHAARNEGKNAIYAAIPVIEYFQKFTYAKTSPLLGPIKTTVSMVNAGQMHNIVPDTCSLTVDVRTTEVINNTELLALFHNEWEGKATIKARGTKLNPSSIATDHPIVKTFESMGCKPFGSPTLSDQALLPFTTVKIGPGDSARSHTADEFVYVHEVVAGCLFYASAMKKYFSAIDN